MRRRNERLGSRPEQLSSFPAADRSGPNSVSRPALGYGSTVTVQVRVTVGSVGNRSLTVNEPSPLAPVLPL